MRISLILAHPRPGSFNHAIAAAARDALVASGHTVFLHDLYAERFDPVLTSEELSRDARLSPSLAAHCDEAATSDGIVIVHPNWWGKPPAILSGWIDRVLRAGVAYRFNEGDAGEGIPAGLLRAKKAVVFNTSDTPAEREQEVFGDPLGRIWKDCVFSFCGIDSVIRKTFRVVVTSSAQERSGWLEDVRRTTAEAFPSA